MGFWREVEINWQGKDYTFTPDMALISRIERKGDLSLLRVISDAENGKPQTSKMAAVVLEVMSAAKIEDVDEEAIFAGLMGADEGEAYALFGAIRGALLPSRPEKTEGDAAA